MITLKTILRAGGVVVAVIGTTFLPVRNYVLDKGDQNGFADVAELAAFVPTAL